MKTDTYSSDREFLLYEVAVSHGQVVLRSAKTQWKSYTVDIVFAGTGYIQMPARMEGITIRKVNDHDLIQYSSVKAFLNYRSNHLFAIESGKEIFFIAAKYVKVFKNKLEFTESQIDAPEGQHGELLAILSHDDTPL